MNLPMLVVVDVMVVGLDEVDVSTETKAKRSFRHITILYDEKFYSIRNRQLIKYIPF